MAQASHLDLLCRLRAAVARAAELELDDLNRQIKALERSKPVSHASQIAGREHTKAMLKVMQQARDALSPHEIANRLNVASRTVSRWLAAAKEQGYVERLGRARYQVKKEVPLL